MIGGMREYYDYSIREPVKGGIRHTTMELNLDNIYDGGCSECGGDSIEIDDIYEGGNTKIDDIYGGGDKGRKV